MAASPTENPKLWLKMVKDRFDQMTGAGELKTLVTDIHLDTAPRERTLPCVIFFPVSTAEPERIMGGKIMHEQRIQFSVFDDTRSSETCMDVVAALHNAFRDATLLTVGSPYTLVDFQQAGTTGPALEDGRVWQHTTDYMATFWNE